MDEQRRSSPHHSGAERSELETDVRPASEARKPSIEGGEVQPSPDGLSREGSQTLVFYGDGQQVREGLALALRAMEFMANQPRPNREDS
jgi:hypothetical protein